MGLNVHFDEDFNDVAILCPDKYVDDRGYFSVTFSQDDFKENIGDYKLVQTNTSRSKRGVIRGLHYQIKRPQGKLITVPNGYVLDFIVDIRKASKNFGKWKKFGLGMRGLYLWVPPGYAHGFCSVLENTIFEYSCTDSYAPEYERTILYCDKDLNLPWPDTMDHIVSYKDLAGTPFKNAEVYQ